MDDAMTQRPHPDRDPGREGQNRLPIRVDRAGMGERAEPGDAPYAIEHVTALTHEIRNLLDGSIRCLGLARRSISQLPGELEGARDATRHLDIAKGALERMADLVNAAMHGSASVVGSPALAPERPITLEEATRHAADVLMPQAQERGISIVLGIDPLAGSVPVGPMYSVILNGLKNSLESIPEGQRGTIDVTIRIIADEAAARDGLRFHLISIQDDGCGLRGRRTAERAFDFGFSTKQTGRGIGLALAREIVRHAGGSIELCQRTDRSSADRPGAVLRVLYPIVNDAPPPPETRE
jgi:signal transduction histidine kinase